MKGIRLNPTLHIRSYTIPQKTLKTYISHYLVQFFQMKLYVRNLTIPLKQTPSFSNFCPPPFLCNSVNQERNEGSHKKLAFILQLIVDFVLQEEWDHLSHQYGLSLNLCLSLLSFLELNSFKRNVSSNCHERIPKLTSDEKAN